MSSKVIQLAVGALMFSGWVIYLAGVANSNSICVKVGNGDYTAGDLVSSVDDADKNFMPLNDPWAMPTSTSSLASLLAGRKLKAEAETLFPSHRRALMSVNTDRCGWTYSFAWWTVGLQGFATILALLVAAGALGAVRHAVTPMLIVNTALLCVIASDLVPQAANLTITKTKGKYPNAIFVTTAGIIITMVANFFFFMVPPVEDISHGMPAEAK